MLRPLAFGLALCSLAALPARADMSYNEADALGKEQEDSLIFRALQEDIAGQVIRRLEAVRV